MIKNLFNKRTNLVISETSVLDQQVLNNNKEIYARIVSELNKAQSEVLIVAAWFTDEELFDILLLKLSEGINVELIIADNQENEKLDFSLLISKGATVIRIKNVGYGVMNQKFCILDKKIALHGSYNWSVNAKKNNHESIIATNHKGTIESLMSNFNDLKEKAIAISSELKPSEPTVESTQQHVEKEDNTDKVVKIAYEKVLDSMIAAEVSSFDRENLRKQGYDRSLLNNGDHNVLHKALDTLYNGFINDIDVIEDKKRRLLSKIDEQKVKSVSQLTDKYDAQKKTIETETEVIAETLNHKIDNLKAELIIEESALNNSKEYELERLNQKIKEYETKIRESFKDFIKPGIKWFEIITTGIFTFALFIYLFVFYSSAAYILLYSEEDAKIALQTSNIIVNPQVFNPDALTKSLEHGWMAFLFVCLFVFIPLIFACLERIISNKLLANILTYGLGLILVDSFIAIKIAQSIHAIKSETEINPKPWEWTDLLTDTNFYLVFILGAFGILLFKFCIEKLNRIADDRNPDIAEQRNKIIKQHLREDIGKIENQITLLNSDIEMKSQEIVQKRIQVKSYETELEKLPLKKIHQIDDKKNDLDNKLQMIETTTDIYKSHVENDNIPVSISALKDRINVFLEGWNDFLHYEYSISKAIEKSAQATDVAINWEYSKINKALIDTRVKVK